MAYLNDDTICALATASGGAMAIIRVSGTQAISIADALFVSPTGHRLADARSHTAHYGTLQGDDGEVLDDVVVTVMRGPHSYTGEDTTEVSCHGSRYIITLILHALIKKGCRQALPGEFTQRAFLNGKLDLSQAEAVADADLINQIAQDDMVRGYTISCGGFYGPQGRILRAAISDPKQNEKVEAFEYDGMRICNFEMESSALAGLASLLGHRAMTCCMVIANRYAKEMNTEYKNSIDTLIEKVLDRM